MKKINAFLICLVICSALYAKSIEVRDTAYVSVKQTTLKTTAGFFSQNSGSVKYGDAVTVLEIKNKKLRVQLKNNSSINGWIANGSVTLKKIVVNKGSTVRASTEELALAGKGFSADAEAAFKSANKNTDYKKVDALEKIVISEKDLTSFIKEGHLSEGDD